MTISDYDRYPMYTTVFGGLVKEDDLYFIFVTPPSGSDLKAGDSVPKGWGLRPLNELAKEDPDLEQKLYIQLGGVDQGDIPECCC